MTFQELFKIVNFYARFTPSYTKLGYYARRTGWGSALKPDFSGQRWLVTGANSGIGAASTSLAAACGAEVVPVARSETRLQQALALVPASSRARIQPQVADLSSMVAIQALVKRLTEEGQRFNVLVNNVGVLLNHHEVTDEGLETSFATNILGHYLLTEGLVAAGALGDGATVVSVSSGGMYNVPLGIGGLNVMDAAQYNGKASYAFAKRAQVALTDYWNSRYGSTGVRFYVMHPGWSKTPGVKVSLPTFWKIQRLLLRTPGQGADTIFWLCAARPDVKQDVIWFDRKARHTHLFEHTRKALCTDRELVAYLDQELNNIPDISGVASAEDTKQ